MAEHAYPKALALTVRAGKDGSGLVVCRKINFFVTLSVSPERMPPSLVQCRDGRHIRLLHCGTPRGKQNWDTLEPVPAGSPVFSMRAKLSAPQTLCSGQCYDAIEELLEQYSDPNLELFRKIKRFWLAYHLNDMHAGTKAQEEFLGKAGMLHTDRFNFDDACQALGDAGLYEDRGYCYGSGWLYRPFDEAAVAEARALKLLA